MKKLIYFLYDLILIDLAASEDVWNKNQEIRKKLLKEYDKMAMPQKDANGTTTVYCHLTINGIWIEEDKQIFTVNSIFDMHWNDARLKWDYKDYGNLDRAHFGDGELWKPDIHVLNNADGTEIDHFGDTHFLVFYNGNVFWFPPAVFKVNCHIDLMFWPFDIQKCMVVITSWTSNGWQINLQISNATTIDAYFLNSESNNWELVSGKQRKLIINYHLEKYIDIEYTFVLKRNSPTFSGIVVVPAIVIPIFLLLQFILPVDHPKRLSIGCCCSILVLLELLFLKYSLPKVGTSVPLIVKYYSQSFVIVIITVAISSVLGRLAHPQNYLVAYPPPEMMKRILKGILATILCLRNHADKVGLCSKAAEDGEVLETSQSPNYSHEWLFIAKVTDRIAVVLLIAVYIFSLIGFVSPIK